MPSWAGTGMVTTCMLTLCSRSASGAITARPGSRTSPCNRPKRSTTPRSNWFTTRTLAPLSTSSTVNRIPSTTTASISPSGRRTPLTGRPGQRTHRRPVARCGKGLSAARSAASRRSAAQQGRQLCGVVALVGGEEADQLADRDPAVDLVDAGPAEVVRVEAGDGGQQGGLRRPQLVGEHLDGRRPVVGQPVRVAGNEVGE